MNRSANIGKYIYSTRPIGKGSFSKVYKGLDTETDEVVAIKIIEKYQLKPDVNQRLHDEITLLAELSHPNIVELYKFIQDDDNFYLVFEYCAGGDLSHTIKKGRIEESQAREYMRQLVEVLSYLKGRNLVHRDLKPQNLLLSADKKTLKVTDFNFARELFDDDLSQTVCGSPLYMAPEIIEKEEYTVQADLWSVGMILYEMIYGRHPYYNASNVIELLHKIKQEPIPYSETVSPECNQLLKGLLQIEPSERLTWEDLFQNRWLRTDEPTYLARVQENMWESVSLSQIAISTRRTQPIGIPAEPQIVDNYVPMGVTPPKYTRSDSVIIHQVRHRQRAVSFGGTSAPERSVADQVWSYMSSSVAVVKGAVGYLSSTTDSFSTPK